MSETPEIYEPNGNGPTPEEKRDLPIAGIVFVLLPDGNVGSQPLNEREAHRNLTEIELRGICDWFRSHLDSGVFLNSLERAQRRVVIPGR